MDADCRDRWDVDCPNGVCVCTQGPGSCETESQVCETAKDCADITQYYRCEAKIEVCHATVPKVLKDSDACAGVGCPAVIAAACPLPEGDNACENEDDSLCLEPSGIVDPNAITTIRRTYCDVSGTIKDVDPEIGEILGATIIKTRWKDRQDERESFLTLVLKHQVDVYLAYDSKADKKPDWLEGKGALGEDLSFTKLTGQLTTTFPQQRSFDVYRKRNAEGILVLPGNAFGATWSIPPSQRAMYFVMLKPRPGQAEICDGIGDTYWEGCFTDKSHAQAKAEAACAELTQPHPWYRCGEPSCEKVFECPDASTQKQYYHLTTVSRSFERRSEVDFQQPMTMTVDNHSRTVDVTGHVDFEFPPDPLPPAKPFVKINSFHGATGEIGEYDEILLALAEPAYAVCQDPSPTRPCVSYQIPKKAFRMLLAAMNGGHATGFTAGTNPNDLPLTIDKPAQPGLKRTFTMQGPVIVPVLEDGTENDMVMHFKATGTFTNFEPEANALESDRWVPCARERNSKHAQLIAVSDADVDETPAFKWYEDFGQSTHRLLGSGSQMSLPPGTFRWGVHHITLVVQDLSVADTDTFELEVFDKEPPTVTPPSDVLALAVAHRPGVAPGPIKLHLGQPYVSDDCSLDVVTFNDAPEGNLFPLGTTEVTWYADDNHGNVAQSKKPQLVLVYGSSEPPDHRLQQLGSFFHSGVANLQEAITSCHQEHQCTADFGPLELATKELYRLLGDLDDSVSADDRRRLQQELTQTRQALTEAARVLGRSNQADGPNRPALRRAAARQLDRAGNRAKAIANDRALLKREAAPR